MEKVQIIAKNMVISSLEINPLFAQLVLEVNKKTKTRMCQPFILYQCEMKGNQNGKNKIKLEDTVQTSRM